jgi:hypothetical protein
MLGHLPFAGPGAWCEEQGMNRDVRAVVISSVISLFSIGCLAQGRKTITNPDGSKDVFDNSTGWTETDKNGKVTNLSPAELASLCGDTLKTLIEFHLEGVEGTRVACDKWAQLQPRTQIEEVSFSILMRRLIEFSPPVTDFARYRGTELRSQTQDAIQSAVYDATIVPNDVGGDTSCTILQAHNASGGALYKYACSIKTASYPEPVTLEKTLVQLLNGLGLIEDQIVEHGLAVQDKENNECAPTGECAHSHMFESAIKDNKTVKVEAQPNFVRNAVLEAQMWLATGRHNFVERIAPDSAAVEFSVSLYGADQGR